MKCSSSLLVILYAALAAPSFADRIYVSHGEMGKGELVDGTTGQVVYDDRGHSGNSDEAAHNVDVLEEISPPMALDEKDEHKEDGDDDVTILEADDVELPNIVVTPSDGSSDDSNESSKSSTTVFLSALMVPVFVIFATFYTVTQVRRREANRRGNPSLRDATTRNLYEIDSLPSHGSSSIGYGQNLHGGRASSLNLIDPSPLTGCRNIV